MRGNLSVNSGELVREAALAGLGIALLPDFFIAGDIGEGRLRSILPDACRVEAGIFLVYPQARYRNTAVRTLIDFLMARRAVLSEVSLSPDQ